MSDSYGAIYSLIALATVFNLAFITKEIILKLFGKLDDEAERCLTELNNRLDEVIQFVENDDAVKKIGKFIARLEIIEEYYDDIIKDNSAHVTAIFYSFFILLLWSLIDIVGHNDYLVRLFLSLNCVVAIYFSLEMYRARRYCSLVSRSRKNKARTVFYFDPRIHIVSRFYTQNAHILIGGALFGFILIAGFLFWRQVDFAYVESCNRLLVIFNACSIMLLKFYIGIFTQYKVKEIVRETNIPLIN